MLSAQTNPANRAQINRQYRYAFIPSLGSAIAVSVALMLGTAHGAFAGETSPEASTVAPISVGGCGVHAGKYPWLWMRFKNTKLAAADEVVFLVQNGWQRRTIADKGLFSHGVAIEHQFRVANMGVRNETSCKVLRVHFVDGTSSGPQDAQRSAPS